MRGLEIEAVVFDLDATLVNLGGYVNWREGHSRVVEAYLECGCREDLVTRYGEAGLFDMLNLMWDMLCETRPMEEAARIQGRAFDALSACEALGAPRCHLVPGSAEALEWLKERGVKMGIATSNSQEVAEQILEAKGLGRFFSAVVGRTPGLRMKPHPDQILTCFQMLAVDPRRGVVVGDSVRDVMAARAAGAYSIAVPAYFTGRRALEEAGADRIIGSLWELKGVLSSLRL
ncbi:MAG: HAD family hydrolase [Candidatus Bathyarchaeia archaeon]